SLNGVGIRYKGFSSVSVDRDKNPFNIDLDYTIAGQDYEGIDKIKLSNVIQDPSFLREVMSYEIARKYMPASRSNFAEVFINDVYWGLYTNVESVNKEFLADHYGNTNNSFFKCNPASIDLFGENSNLNNNLGTDSSAYYELYDLKSDAGWSDLLSLLDTLNEHPQEIESVLNVDRALWMHAFNYSLVNFDSYIGYSQNFYLYADDNGLFNCIPWDLNQSFASYRLSDASEFWDGFTIDEAKTIDPLLHLNSVSVIPRPLMRNLWENDTYKRMYIAHMRTIMEENFMNDLYLERALEYHNLIDASVLADTNKFYGYDDFLDNIDITVTDLVEYPGIGDLMEARKTYLSTYPGYQNGPSISDISTSLPTPSLGDPLSITAAITNSNTATLAYRHGGSGLFIKVDMLDDGSQGDGAAGDGIYGFTIPEASNSIHYYLYAENDEAGRFAPKRAAYEYFITESQLPLGSLVINEVMSQNFFSQTDEAGEFEDWIELYNPNDFTISLSGLYLSDDILNVDKWALPNETLDPQSYLIIWADEDAPQGIYHSNFKLSSIGEYLGLAYADGTTLDSLHFPAIDADITWGRFPNATGPFTYLPPSFAAENFILGIEEQEKKQALLYPNPAQETVFITSDSRLEQIQLSQIDGKILLEKDLNGFETRLELGQLPTGLYLVRLRTDVGQEYHTLLIEN
ncbi:MAG: hypothetical protein ACI8U0_001936, partial [Flavobacteriales bacterium]